MKRINIAKSSVAVVMKCKSGDEKPGRNWCIYDHNESTGEPKKNQPKGFPKTFTTREDAEEQLERMEMFKNFSTALTYPGNIGIIELFKFYDIATEAQKDKLNEIMERGDWKKFKKIISEVLGVDLK